MKYMTNNQWHVFAPAWLHVWQRPKGQGSVIGIIRDAYVIILTISLFRYLGVSAFYTKLNDFLVKYTVLNGLYLYICTSATTQSSL